MNAHPPNKRHGIVLVIVLAMLSLFSVLIVSYVIFTGQVASITELVQADEDNFLPSDLAAEIAVSSLISGSANPHSAAFGNSILDDLWGPDGLLMRVGHNRIGATQGPMPATSDGIDSRGSLLQPLNGSTNQPQTTLFKFPTSFASWHDDGTVPLTGTINPLPASVPPAIRHIDDSIAGRQLTFIEGPLEGTTFQIVRSFGGNNVDDPGTPDDIEGNLAGNVVIDLRQVPNDEIFINGVTYNLYVTAAQGPNYLLYDLGDDGSPGRAGFDDDGDSAVDEPDEIGYPDSDDFGYRFIVNGVPFNGLGQNPAGVSGLKRGPTPIDARADIELQFNARLMGATAHGADTSSGSFPQQDEAWDAADFENIFLGWQPSDHRRANHSVWSDPALDNLLGSEIIPSFHRPEVINYLMNAPIVLPTEDPTVSGYVPRTFWDLDGTDTLDADRLGFLVMRLRRATIRPLHFEHLFINPVVSDLDGDGSPYDGAPEFTGSNTTPIFSSPIAIDTSQSFSAMKSKVETLAKWLVNGPWDVDNDGDGIPDSLWIDLQLPSLVTSTGQVVRAMIAPLIEDFDGKINVNYAGNYRQLLTPTFSNTNPTSYSNDAQYLAASQSLNLFGRGSGVGPAEIHFGHLFDEGSTIPPGFFGPIYHTQTSGVPFHVLLTRYGNLMNARYGGVPVDYSGSVFLSSQIHYPGFGNDSNTVAELSEKDQLARIPFPARQASASLGNAMGKPMDLAGVSRERKDRYGNATFDNLSTPPQIPKLNEITNQPYEFNLSGDTPFTEDDLIGLIDGYSGTGALDSLLRDEIIRNQSLRNLITTESRSIDVPEVSGSSGMIGYFLKKLTASDVQTHLDRMVAPEFRKGARLNLNRVLGNGADDNSDGLFDEPFETIGINAANVIARQARQVAFPQISDEYAVQAAVRASYQPLVSRRVAGKIIDFDGYDSDNDGVLDGGNDVDGDGHIDRIADGNELLARHLYCLMFFLIADPTKPDLVPDFPFPANFTTDTTVRRRYVGRRLAQWAVNVVDFRDSNAIATRLRYDPNPFNGFDLDEAARNVVWGMERPEIAITETFASHDKRIVRNLTKAADPMAPGKTPDGEEMRDDATSGTPDSDPDQFRIPEATTIVEIQSLRSPSSGVDNQPSLPAELYTGNTLDLGRVVGTGNNQSPVWRLAVGEAVQGDTQKSIRWLYDAERISRNLAAKDDGTADYLKVNAPANWSNPAAELANWRAVQKYAAEVRPLVTGTGESVTLSDADLDPINDSTTNGNRIQLTRFVWFANLAPTSGMKVISDPNSGMKLGNVFFNRLPNATPAQLALGQYAVIAPRVQTVFGQTTDSKAPDYAYKPSPQLLEFKIQTPTAANLFRLNYQDLSASPNPETPKYREDAGAGVGYQAEAVLPIIAQSLYPDQVDNTLTNWANYRSTVPADEQVAIGFNVSAPLSGPNYYLAPTYKINSDAGKEYPLVDGYRDYVNSIGFHPDEPLDHEGLGGGAGPAAPLAQNNWAGVGTHQEAVGVFLQRLADPTAPWHPIDNPYLTMDLAPVDLTTFNGEADSTETTDRGAGAELADNASQFDGTDFTPKVRFDSRRKIPDTQRDRAATDLVQTGNSSNSLSSFERQIFTERPALSASFSVLRESPEATSTANWKFNLGAMWDSSHSPADTGIDSSFLRNAAWEPYHPSMDLAGTPYRQTLGFVNREYGRPIGGDGPGGSDNPDVNQYGRGTPRGSSFLMPEWDDRDFQSPIDVINVPAASQTGLLTQFSPGTLLQDTAEREIATHFEHLLGFEHKFSQRRTASDLTPLYYPGQATSVGTSAVTPNVLTGDRAPFELILDLVGIGGVSYLESVWFDAESVKYLAPTDDRNRMFNRVVEFLQPPFNYMPANRTPGKINLNTTPDYLRKGGGFASAFPIATFPDAQNEMLDIGERANDKTIGGTGGIGYDTIVPNVSDLSAIYSASPLFGNGSVYRSFAWAMSTAYELDDAPGQPSVLGDIDEYDKIIGSRFGRGFKAFIESRRGYDTTALSSRPSLGNLGNPNLDWRYPSRFAGMFATAQAAETPSVQRFLRPIKEGLDSGIRRRTHDMTVMRPHPDFDERLLRDTDKAALDDANNTIAFSLNVESDPTGGAVTLPAVVPGPIRPYVNDLRMTRANQGLFERTLPELHKDFRHLARVPSARFENASRLKNLTTYHSNVFLIRMTVGFFVVDSATGAVGQEYADPYGTTQRTRFVYVVDRSIPTGFLPGVPANSNQTIIYSASR